MKYPQWGAGQSADRGLGASRPLRPESRRQASAPVARPWPISLSRADNVRVAGVHLRPAFGSISGTRAWPAGFRHSPSRRRTPWCAFPLALSSPPPDTPWRGQSRAHGQGIRRRSDGGRAWL